MKRVLIIAPHADDEVLGCGGTIVKHVQQGDDVTVVVVSNRDGLETTQQKQAEACKNVLGYKKLYFLNFRDECLDMSMREIIKSIEAIYAKHKPHVVYTCHEGDINIDHQTVFNASMVVTRPLQTFPPAKVMCYEIPSSTTQCRLRGFFPNTYNTIDDEQLKIKIQGFYKYTKELRDEPNPRNQTGIRAYAVFRGMECKSQFAEAFITKYQLI